MVNGLFLGIVVFLIMLAVFDLVVGVSNDAVNFLNSAIGAKVAKFRTIVAIAAIGVFAGAVMSNGMMDVARHGIMTPEYFSFYDVMCVFLAVMVTDVVLLDIFNTLGMPTSTTVSMVFELLGGAFAIALLQIMKGATGADGTLLSLGDLLNTEKAISVILGIFLSVAIAFVLGTLVQWIARMVFTFRPTPSPSLKGRGVDTSIIYHLKTGIFGGISVTAIIWFLLINGLKGSSLMTPELKETINQNTWQIIGGSLLLFSILMTLWNMISSFVANRKLAREGVSAPLHFREGEGVGPLRFIVLLGTFALAMAFAGNDLVNFVGVPLTGLEAYQDFVAHSDVDASEYMMTSLKDSAQTPAVYLILAGVVMVLALVFSKKAQNVVKTSVDLSRQDEGDEMFGSSGVARTLVRTSSRMANGIVSIIPENVGRWIDSRFNADAAVLKKGAAFDEIRAAVNLVLAGTLVALGTSLKLPLSTTYVTFMVAMGTSLADRAWSRESAVFRITGVLSVIGGWFITAGAAFTVCYIVTNLMHFGGFIAMALAIVLAIYLLVRSNVNSQTKTRTQTDELFTEILHTDDKDKCWQLLRQHVGATAEDNLQFISKNYEAMTTAFFQEEYRQLKKATSQCSEQRKDLKRQRRKQIVGLRKIHPLQSIEKGTWYFLIINSLSQMIYCMKRMGDPCREHVGNNFRPVPSKYVGEFLVYRNEIVNLIGRTFTAESTDQIRTDAERLQSTLSDYRKRVIIDIQSQHLNIESMTVFLNLVQESQELLSGLRHTLRGMHKFGE